MEECGGPDRGSPGPVGGVQQVAEGALDRVIGVAIPLGGKQAVGELAPSWFDLHGDVSLWSAAAASVRCRIGRI